MLQYLRQIDHTNVHWQEVVLKPVVGVANRKLKGWLEVKLKGF